MQNSIAVSGKRDLSAGVSNTFTDLPETGNYCNQARQSVKQKICLGKQSIILFSDIENIVEMDMPIINFDIEVITDFIVTAQKSEISNYMIANLAA